MWCVREVREAWDRDRASERETQQTLQIVKCGMDGMDGMGEDGGSSDWAAGVGVSFLGGVPGGH